MYRRHLIAAAASLAAAPTLRAQSGPWPNQPVKLMIGFPPGGPTDITMRALADSASKLLGQTVVIDNRPGAGGTLPAQALQQAKPDGYTLAQIPLGVFRLPYTTKIAWDPVADITYILGITGYAFGIVVPADGPIKQWSDFVAYAKANPGKLSYGSTGVLTSPHLTTEDIAQRLGLALNHIPYKGSADLMQSLLGGQIMAAADSTGFAPHVASGKLRVLNTWGEQRLAKFPDVPTLKELGIPIVQASPYGLGGPKGMDPALVQRIHDAFKQAMEAPAHVEALAKYDQQLMPMTPAQYTRFAEDTFKREKALVDKLGLAKPS
ncbi:MAG TPA: tripartite tricarboxylate transporter substrate binding protein [Burkholderiaceae bacterium]|nr:tripartite tricarboxylate transporter substrate binding protein [Burkholderiaceae bacterium]